jgi:2-polyprenyl-3-methyl-5-hydroxy-6-metoxy-1,4-benzoquinol methylase
MEEINEGILRQFRCIQPARGRVLDVGCGRAALGRAIRGLGWEVWGIERDEEACTTARGRLHRLIEAGLLDEGFVQRQLGETGFDCLIFSDVLEHLYDPRTVLETYLRYVKPGGKVLISVPNAVVWTNRLQWMFGRVTYADTGVMDRTHIRFFTFRTARQLVEATGCRVIKMDFTPYLVRAALPLVKRLVGGNHLAANPNPRALIDSKGYRFYMRYLYPAERVLASLWKKMFAFRIIVVAVKK